MSKRIRPTIFLFVLVVLASSYTSCELINPEEQIPSFLRIDSFLLSTNASTEGNPASQFTDAWVYNDEKLVGIYELPAIVPILKAGEANIRIRGGIKLNGQVGSRIPNLFTKDFQATLELFPDSQLHVNPTLQFNSWVNFDWLEDFDDSGVSISQTTTSEGDLDRIGGAEAYDDQSLKLSLSADELLFECKKVGDPIVLPGGGTPVLIEFTYRCNNAFVFGLFSNDLTGTVQNPVIVLNPSEEWNHVYINLTSAASSNPNYTGHLPFFGFIKDEDVAGESFVYLDNIRLLH
ncbi:MAG: hypothetical protein KBF73_01085 [Flavobacteriales bacterium]|nr:hypothetical protein [Flavobacteriales bacterium]